MAFTDAGQTSVVKTDSNQPPRSELPQQSLVAVSAALNDLRAMVRRLMAAVPEAGALNGEFSDTSGTVATLLATVI
jgi:hypothetical protein